MQWEKLLSLTRQGDTKKRLRKDQDHLRLGYDSDYDRIIFSSAFRSLQDKTQVIPLSKTDFVHTRLTHSLEVSVVGRTLGRMVGQAILQKYPYLATDYGHVYTDFGTIVAAASLAHDIGNPPFGHFGERAIGDYFKIGNGLQYKNLLSDKEWQDLIDFEGNANGFSVLTSDRPGVEGALRLSYATLGAFMKYPKESLPKKPTTEIQDKKYGFFQADKQTFQAIATDLGLIDNGDANSSQIRYKRHPLTFLVEAADDICYTIIDFEDGINLQWIDAELIDSYLKPLTKAINQEKYNELMHVEDKISYLRAVAINSLIQDAVQIFLKHEEEILNGTFTCALMDKSQFKEQINNILSICVKKVYQSNDVLEKELKGFQIINFLLDKFCTAYNNQFENKASAFDTMVLKLLPPRYQEQKSSLYLRLLNMAHFVSMLSDGKALQMYKTLNV
ncbi:dNTP triphosphohydrolase [Flavobacterium agricola]|uniref:DNTP triphosphohydrolase n=1 Tax=Flavobacterium agricola TaxID=2870839 RepID=A0ABY6M299_9FLAO|nr:dNTP triphosphohydrolase [Flavobacterium agricola]UYW02639.1 dNTP triphosphohydrolase [Flavobacterium agricola]